jgi:integrase
LWPTGNELGRDDVSARIGTGPLRNPNLPIDFLAERDNARLEREINAGVAMTVNDAMKEYFRLDIEKRDIEYRRKNRRFFERIREKLGTVPLATLAANPELIIDRLGVAERWHDHHGDEHKVLSHLRRAIATVKVRCKLKSNPPEFKDNLDGMVPKHKRATKSREALPYKDMCRFMPALRGYEGNNPSGYMGHPTIAYLLEFDVLVGSRIDEVCRAQWKEINRQEMVWYVPPGHQKKTKGVVTKIRAVPITKPMLDVLDAMEARRSDPSDDEACIFPAPRTKRPYHKEQVLRFLQLTLEWEGKEKRPDGKGTVTVHGFRTTFRTWARWKKYPDYLIEAQLGHVEQGIKKFYGSGVRPEMEDETLDERRHMMEDYGSFCGLTEPRPAKIIPMRATK